MKKTFLTAIAVFLVAGLVQAAPQGMGMRGRAGNRGPGMLFRFVAMVRADLGLSAEQNQKLDALLKEVRDFSEQQKAQMRDRARMLGDEFVSDDFNAAAIQQQRKQLQEQRREQVTAFMTSRVQQLHDLLTREQRQKLLDLMKARREQRMNRMRGRRPMGRRGAGF